MISLLTLDQRARLLSRARLLAVVTIVWNLGEGAFSTLLGANDETLALFGFGLDSFIEVISAVGIWHMVRRLQSDPAADRDRFEQTALRITGGAFYLLAAGLLVTALLSLREAHRPESTLWGIVISVISMAGMGLLIRLKTDVGRALGSAAILADAACSRACLYLSVALFASSLGFLLTGFGGLDALGAGVIALFAAREGREAFAKARGESCGCSGGCTG